MLVRRSLAAVIAFAVAGVLATGGAVAGTPGEVSTYPVKPGSNLLPGPEGVLVRDFDEPAVVNVVPDGGVTSRSVPMSASDPIAMGPAGDLWLGDVHGGFFGPEAQAVDRITPDGAVQTFLTPAAPRHEEVYFRGLVAAGSGAAWAAIGYEDNEGFPQGSTIGGKLLYLSPDGQTKRFTLPHALYPEGLVLGPEGSVWFTAVTGRRVAEKSYNPGTGFVGRLDSDGQLALFRTPVRGGAPGAIAVGPDGKLWFTESGEAAIDTIAPDGEFGRRYSFRLGSPEESIAFGPEGDLWTAVRGGIARMTPWGQQTFFPVDLAYDDRRGVVAGGEGDIWSLGQEDIERRVPGAPGLDIRRVTGRMSAGTIGLLLACGGSASACEGTLDVELPTPPEYRRRHKGEQHASSYRLAKVLYAVPAESQALLRVPVSTKALSLISLFRHYEVRDGMPLGVRATVAGGPSLSRELLARLGAPPETR